jgi:hypothetical protein
VCICCWKNGDTGITKCSSDTTRSLKPTTLLSTVATTVTTTPQPLYCYIQARVAGVPVYTTVDSFAITKTLGTWRDPLQVMTQTYYNVWFPGNVSTDSIYSQYFEFGYTGTSVGGSANINVYANDTMLYPFTPLVVKSLIYPAYKSSTFTCKPTYVYQFDSINCTFSAKRSSVSVYTSWALINSSMGIPYSISGDPNWSGIATFGSFSPLATYAIDYTGSIALGNVTGIYKVGMKTYASPSTSVTVLVITLMSLLLTVV